MKSTRAPLSDFALKLVPCELLANVQEPYESIGKISYGKILPSESISKISNGKILPSEEEEKTLKNDLEQG